jgi:protein TonB
MAVIGGVLLAAAAAGTWLVISRRQPPPAPAIPTPQPTAVVVPTAAPQPGTSTAAVNAAEFKEEVSRRVSEAMKKLEEEAQRQKEAAEAEKRAELAATATAVAAASPTALPTAVVVAQLPEPTSPPPPTATPLPAHEIPPAILKVVKPIYPPMALQARVGGLVILRVLVSETGEPLDVEVVRPGKAGLTEAAIAAVKRWTFTPARKGDTPVRAWTTVPIPFQP